MSAEREMCWTYDQLIARTRFFPGSWNYNANVMAKLPAGSRPFFRVVYATIDELNLAKSVEPMYVNVEYVYEAQKR